MPCRRSSCGGAPPATCWRALQGCFVSRGYRARSRPPERCARRGLPPPKPFPGGWQGEPPRVRAARLRRRRAASPPPPPPPPEKKGPRSRRAWSQAPAGSGTALSAMSSMEETVVGLEVCRFASRFSNRMLAVDTPPPKAISTIRTWRRRRDRLKLTEWPPAENMHRRAGHRPRKKMWRVGVRIGNNHNGERVSTIRLKRGRRRARLPSGCPWVFVCCRGTCRPRLLPESAAVLAPSGNRRRCRRAGREKLGCQSLPAKLPLPVPSVTDARPSRCRRGCRRRPTAESRPAVVYVALGEALEILDDIDPGVTSPSKVGRFGKIADAGSWPPEQSWRRRTRGWRQTGYVS